MKALRIKATGAVVLLPFEPRLPLPDGGVLSLLEEPTGLEPPTPLTTRGELAAQPRPRARSRPG